MDDYDELSTVIRQHVLLDYLMNIRTKMNVLKNKDIQGIIDREDHQTILAVQEKQMNNQRIEMGNLLKENLGTKNDSNIELDHREHLELIETKYQEIETQATQMYPSQQYLENSSLFHTVDEGLEKIISQEVQIQDLEE